MDDRNCFILMIVKPGEIRYANSEYGDFLPARKGQLCVPYQFCSRQSALAAFDRWAKKYPADAVEWVPRVEEAEL